MKLYLDKTDGIQSLSYMYVPKLKYEHVYLTNFSKMRVDLAVQVHSYYSNLCLAIILYMYCSFEGVEQDCFKCPLPEGTRLDSNS